MSARKTFLLYLFVSILLYAVSWMGLLRGPMGFTEQWVLIPIKSTVLSVTQAVIHIREIAAGYTQIRELMEDRAHALQSVEELQHGQRVLKDENDRLRKQLDVVPAATYPLVPATVTGISSQMEVAAGERDGVKHGMSVIVGQTLIGQVTDVSRFRSRVMLLSDPLIFVPIRTSRGVTGVLNGRAGNQLIVDRILQKDPMFLGDQIYTTGEGAYPPNMLIGSVSFITSTDVAVYKQATVMSPVDYREVRVVFIVLSV